MRLVDKMDQQPGTCVACGGNPIDIDGNPQTAVDLEVDVNWGDQAYLCNECINLIADLIERPKKEKIQKIVDQNKFLNRRNKELAAELEKKENLIKRIKDGQAAIREVKEAKSADQ